MSERNKILERELRTSEEITKILEAEMGLMREKYEAMERELKAVEELNKVNELMLKADS